MTKHLITIDQLQAKDINLIHGLAANYFKQKQIINEELKGKSLINLFFENSTRTRTSFEIAAKRLGVKVVNMDLGSSSLKKGETIIDTAKTINAMNPDFVVIRHNMSGMVSNLQKYFTCSLINAGDGTNEHPSQALLDSFVIKYHKNSIEGLNIAICGDTLHSRVARSNIKCLTKLGANICLITTPTLIPKDYANWLQKNWGIKLYESLEEGISNADIIMMLRIQQERMIGGYISSLEEYFKLYGLNHEKLQNAKKDVLVMHPGPINRDVEISSALADDPKISLILEQVEAGVAIRQGIIKFLAA
jgi:aspartate carbamoyltransferase catalytic subunit